MIAEPYIKFIFSLINYHKILKCSQSFQKMQRITFLFLMNRYLRNMEKSVADTIKMEFLYRFKLCNKRILILNNF
jgi:hypothetical protein